MFEFGLKSPSSWEGGCYLVYTCNCFSVSAGTVCRLPLWKCQPGHSTVPPHISEPGIIKTSPKQYHSGCSCSVPMMASLLGWNYFFKSDNCSPASYGCKLKDNFVLGSLTFPYSGLLSWKQHTFQLEKSPNTSALSSWTAHVGSASPVLRIWKKGHRSFSSILKFSAIRLRWPSQHPPLLTESIAAFVCCTIRKFLGSCSDNPHLSAATGLGGFVNSVKGAFLPSCLYELFSQTCIKISCGSGLSREPAQISTCRWHSQCVESLEP